MGQILICVDDSGNKHLTKGREYRVCAPAMDGDDDRIRIIDDSGNEGLYYYHRFSIVKREQLMPTEKERFDSEKHKRFVICNRVNDCNYITVGKLYFLADSQNDKDSTFIKIFNDRGNLANYNASWFSSIQDLSDNSKQEASHEHRFLIRTPSGDRYAVNEEEAHKLAVNIAKQGNEPVYIFKAIAKYELPKEPIRTVFLV